MKEKDDYKSLLEKLEAFDWPRVYMFKFIVPADNQKIAEVQNLFASDEAQIELRPSKTGKYTSVSAKELMLSPEKVVDRYVEASKIEGILSL